MTGWLVVFPLVLLGGAALAAFTFVRMSTLRITPDGVENLKQLVAIRKELPRPRRIK